MPEGIEEIHQSCQTGEARCCGVERRPGVAPRPTSVEGLGSADWSARIHVRFLEKSREQETSFN